MKKRLTVHLTNVPQTTTKTELVTAEGKTVIKSKKILVNTLSFVLDKGLTEKSVLDSLTSKGNMITKHYLSNIN
jgi:hypothetical protein